MSRPRSRLGLPKRRSSTSSGSIKIDLNETAQDKARYKIHTKADPTLAINEAQPSQLQAIGETTIAPLRSMEHRDADGNTITDPDRSNPTRPRLERPLDTIRSFEAAIDGSYNRRQSLRAESANPMSPQNRRSGFFNGYQPPHRNANDSGGGGYYGNRHSVNYGRADSYVDGYGNSHGQHHSGRRFGPRNHSDPALYGRNGEQPVYQSHGHQQSYDTVGTTSNGSHQTDQWGNSTDPSSENSSIDKYQPPPAPPKADLAEQYGFNGFGGAPQFQGPILEEYSASTPAYGEVNHGPPPPPAKGRNGFARPIHDTPPRVPPHRAPVPPPKTTSTKTTLTKAPVRAGPPAVESRGNQASENGEKRKSWLKRRFSRSK